MLQGILEWDSWTRMGGWVSKASRLCWSLHPKGSTDFSTRVQWRACASDTGGANMFYRKWTPGTWTWIPLEKERHRTETISCWGSSCPFSWACWSLGCGKGPVRDVPKTYLTKTALSTRLVFFCGGTGEKKFCPISPTFSTIGLVRKKAKDHGMILLKQKKVRGVNVRSTWFPILTFHKSQLFKKKGFCSKFGLSFLLPFTHPVGFPISHSLPVLFQPEKIRWRRLPDVNCRASGGSWVYGLMDGWFREFPKMPGRVLLFWLQKSGHHKTSWGCRIFSHQQLCSRAGESGWWRIFMFDKDSLLYYRWVVASRRPNSSAQHMVDASQRSRCFMSHI